jgi:hypothetical protein
MTPRIVAIVRKEIVISTRLVGGSRAATTRV